MFRQIFRSGDLVGVRRLSQSVTVKKLVYKEVGTKETGHSVAVFVCVGECVFWLQWLACQKMFVIGRNLTMGFLSGNNFVPPPPRVG